MIDVECHFILFLFPKKKKKGNFSVTESLQRRNVSAGLQKSFWPTSKKLYSCNMSLRPQPSQISQFNYLISFLFSVYRELFFKIKQNYLLIVENIFFTYVLKKTVKF